MDIYRKLKTLKKSQLLKNYNKLNNKKIKEIKKIKENTRNDIINLILQPLQIKRRTKYRMKYRMKRKSDRITILRKYIISDFPEKQGVYHCKYCFCRKKQRPLNSLDGFQCPQVKVKIY